MNTRTRIPATPSDAPTDNVHVEALGKAMAAHPAVKVEIDALRRQLQAAERKSAALQGVLDDYADQIGAVRKVALADASPGLTDAECLAKFDAMTPAEKALVMMKARPAQRFGLDSPAHADGVFAGR